MFNVKFKEKAREARKNRVRNKIHGTIARPRLAVFKSAKQIYVQLIDDDKGLTLASASTLADEIQGKGKERAASLGKLIAERATGKGIVAVVFDRASYRYHGQIKELADAARTGGLKF